MSRAVEEAGRFLSDAKHSQAPRQSARSQWDLFLSHSGAQKGFAKSLFEVLKPSYNVFFDITRPSLPPADHFPSHIFHAARTCRLALVVLSNEFICSKWPMIELSTFVDAGVKILPLFYKLSPAHLKNSEKLEEWNSKWEELAAQDRRIRLSSWAHALQTLCSINGLIFNKSDGELAYLNQIVSTIHQITPPFIKFSHAGIHGADRLCKVFIDKFKELERRQQHPSDAPKVYLLGIYGLPGSGKTTLCACLRDHFFSDFAGRALHLKLPTDPTSTELLEGAKELLKLTNYHLHLRQELISSIVDLPQMYSILKASNLRSSRSFLVIDNISSRDSIESVEAILQLGLGAGSRVMLVARSLNTLDPLLSFQKDHMGHIHYVCGSMQVPTINENEAFCVLMQRGGGLGLTEENSCAVENEFRSRHKEIITKVVRMCAFRSQSHYAHQEFLYLPLALKIMGSELRSNGTDLEKWERQSLRLEAIVKELKEHAVRRIVEESFEKLSKKLKLLFLDVALFMVPYGYCRDYNYEASIELLSFMHECRPDTILREINDLRRLCFLDLELGFREIIVHDIFLEFAKSVSAASCMYYYCRGRNLTEARVKEEMVGKSQAGLRALILELDEKCDRYDFPAGFSNVRVLIVRNCKSLVALGLAGLTSLVTLEVEDCPRLTDIGIDPSHLCTLKSVKWANGRYCDTMCDPEQQGSFVQSILLGEQEGISASMHAKQLINNGWCRMLHTFSGWLQWPSRVNGVISLASQLKGLQILRLERTGITSLEDASRCWPNLRVLEVLEDRLERMELGNLPNLEQFFLGAGCVRSDLIHPNIYNRMKSESTMSRKPNLLAGCPQLEDVRISIPPFEDGMGAVTILSRSLRTLWLKNIQYGEPVLPDFTSSAHSLEEIVVWNHRVLQTVVFTCQLLGLRKLSLGVCCSLVKITGLELLPDLRQFDVTDCVKLETLTGLEGCRMLQNLNLSCCPVLVHTSQGLSTLVHLQSLSVSKCPNVQLLLSDLENLTALRFIQCKLFRITSFKVRDLVNLEAVMLESELSERKAPSQIIPLCCAFYDEAKCEQEKYMPLLLLENQLAPAHLYRLSLCAMQNLVCLDGIHCLQLTLKHLDLSDLPGLTCLQGLESLICLESLIIERCQSVEELPSLCTLVNMDYFCICECVNLKFLDGFYKLMLLETAEFDICENLELGPATLQHLLHSHQLERLWFRRCKFASIEAMLEWVLDESVSKAAVKASWRALLWEFTHHVVEKPGERLELAVRLVETLAAYVLKKIPLNEADCFDFQPWVNDLKKLWRWVRSEELQPVHFPRELVELMRGLVEVPVKGMLLLLCAHSGDAEFSHSVAHCLLETHPKVLYRFILPKIPK